MSVLNLLASRLPVGTREVVYLVSVAGFPNLGDELIAEAWLRHLAARRPAAVVVVDSPRPGQAALLLQHANPAAVFVDTLWRRVFAPGDGHRSDPVDDLHRSAGSDPGARLLLRAGTVHIVGGGFLNGLWPHHLALVPAVAAVTRSTGGRAVASGAGLTPGFAGLDAEDFRAAVDGFDVFDVRDAPSAEYLGPVRGASFTGDDAWLSAAVARPEPGPPEEAGVVVCAQGDLTDDFSWRGDRGVTAVARFIEATLDEWAVAGPEVVIAECNPGIDAVVANRLGARLDGAERLSFQQVWASGLPTGRGRTWVSTRFHPHLIAASAGDSGVAVIAKPDYYGTKHASLSEAGSAWTLVGPDCDVPPRPCAGGFSPATVATNRSRKAALAHRLYPPGTGLR